MKGIQEQAKEEVKAEVAKVATPSKEQQGKDSASSKSSTKKAKK
jgi:hypothetical protein